MLTASVMPTWYQDSRRLQGDQTQAKEPFVILTTHGLCRPEFPLALRDQRLRGGTPTEDSADLVFDDRYLTFWPHSLTGETFNSCWDLWRYVFQSMVKKVYFNHTAYTSITKELGDKANPLAFILHQTNKCKLPMLKGLTFFLSTKILHRIAKIHGFRNPIVDLSTLFWGLILRIFVILWWVLGGESQSENYQLCR